jgi:hypothetical protein
MTYQCTVYVMAGNKSVMADLTFLPSTKRQILLERQRFGDFGSAMQSLSLISVICRLTTGHLQMKLNKSLRATMASTKNRMAFTVPATSNVDVIEIRDLVKQFLHDKFGIETSDAPHPSN